MFLICTCAPTNSFTPLLHANRPYPCYIMQDFNVMRLIPYAWNYCARKFSLNNPWLACSILFLFSSSSDTLPTTVLKELSPIHKNHTSKSVFKNILLTHANHYDWNGKCSLYQQNSEYTLDRW